LIATLSPIAILCIRKAAFALEIIEHIAEQNGKPPVKPALFHFFASACPHNLPLARVGTWIASIIPRA